MGKSERERERAMKLDIFQDDLKQGYFYALINDKGESIALGYYKLEKHAIYWGELALKIARESESK